MVIVYGISRVVVITGVCAQHPVLERCAVVEGLLHV